MKELFFSTVFPEQLTMFCAWQEKAPFNQTGSERKKYIPLFLYGFRWNIEVSYYEQKTFWSLCNYMIRSRNGIEMLVNLITISYCAMKILPYQDVSLKGAFSCHAQNMVSCSGKTVLKKSLPPLPVFPVEVTKAEKEDALQNMGNGCL